MSAGADFSTVLKIQHHNDSVKPQVSFFCSGIQTDGMPRIGRKPLIVLISNYLSMTSEE
jgi:hypothetical protein